MIVKLLTEHHLECPSFKGGCRGSSESTLAKMSNCWKSRALTHIIVISLFVVVPIVLGGLVFSSDLMPLSIEPVHEISNNVLF